ncbi:MAG: hypothetical protein ABGZ35_18645 [Planctomycetaceae bacterium]
MKIANCISDDKLNEDCPARWVAGEFDSDDELAVVTTTIEIIHDGDYVLAAGQVAGPDDDGFYQFVEDHYVVVPVTGLSGDIKELVCRFDFNHELESAASWASGVFASSETVPTITPDMIDPN